jgi:hypothetical protein
MGGVDSCLEADEEGGLGDAGAETTRDFKQDSDLGHYGGTYPGMM